MSTTTVPPVSPDEDHLLRRLHWLELNGAVLAPKMRALKEEIRARDLRLEIREPVEGTFIEPLRLVG